MLLFILLGIVSLASNSKSIASPARLPQVSVNRTIPHNSLTDSKISSSSNSSGSDQKVPSINSQRTDKKLSFEPEFLDTNFYPTPPSDLIKAVESDNEQIPEKPLENLENVEKSDEKFNEPDPDLSKPLSPFELSTIKQEEINNENENFIPNDQNKDIKTNIDGEAIPKKPNVIQPQNTQNSNVQNQNVLNLNLDQKQNLPDPSDPVKVKNISLLQTALNKVLKEDWNTSMVSFMDPSVLWSTSGDDLISPSEPSLLSRLDYFNLGKYVDLKMIWLVPLVLTGLTMVLLVGLIYHYATTSFLTPLSLLSILPSFLEQPLEQKYPFELSVLKALYDPQSFMGSNFRRF